MINKLRFKFIRITMIAVLTVLILIISTINIVNFSRNTQSLDEITQRLSESNIFEKDKPKPEEAPPLNFAGFNRGRPFPFQNEKELPFATRFFFIHLDKEKNIEKFNLNQIASVTENDLESIANGILKKEETVGWYDSYRFRVSKTNNGYLLIVVEATSTLSSMLYVLFITLAVGLVSFVLIFIIIALLSKRIITPVAQVYDKQKQFITDASHELKTPLTVISANTEILALSYGENEWCEGISRQTEIMRNLIGQMIEMAKLDEGTSALTMERFNFSDAAYDTVMSFSTLAAQHTLKLSTEITSDICIKGNEAALRQVVAILMDNAVKYCDEGGEISVILGLEEKNIILSVENSFAALDALDEKLIFERFYRNDKAREKANSFGLGLSIAKSIAEQHKGTLICKKDTNGKIRFVLSFKNNITATK